MTTNIPTISFSHPRRGLSGEFATFRLGSKVAEKHPIGSRVDLIDSRSKKVLKRATVVSLHTGVLTEMAQLHAHQAHNWKEHPEAERPGLLIASILKRFKHYGPTRCSENSLVTVIYLQEIQGEQPNQHQDDGRKP